MGKIIKELYRPKDINWKARHMIEVYSQRPAHGILEPQKKSRWDLYAGVFCLVMAAVAAGLFFLAWGKPI